MQLFPQPRKEAGPITAVYVQSSNEFKHPIPEYSLEGLKLKLQYIGYPMQRADSLEKTLILWKDWRQEEKGTTENEMVGLHHQLNGHEFE